MKPTWVYIMRLDRGSWILPRGFVKIGYSNHIPRRIDQLNSKWEEDGEKWEVVEVVTSWRLDTREEAERLEKFCHWCLDFLRWSGKKGWEREQFFMPWGMWKIVRLPVWIFKKVMS